MTRRMSMAGSGDRTLVVNVGSSSVKFKLFEGDSILLDGVIDHIGKDAVLDVKRSQMEHVKSGPVHASNHHQAGQLLLHMLEGVQIGRSIHRVVHGGKHTTAVRADAEALQYIASLTPLAPLHIPASLELIRLCSDKIPETILCFDTMFHATMPAIARTYAIPHHLAAKHHIYRFGFHGLAHSALAQEAARMSGKPIDKLRIISCQLGNGASVCAVRNGVSIDTSMGFTPLEGLMMGTRSGDIDPAIIPFLCEAEKMPVNDVLHLLEKKSGLLALGGSSDMRDVLKKSTPAAKLAVAVYAYRVRKYIGAYMATLGGVDCIVLGGGVSRAPAVRMLILSGLEEFGIVLDEKELAKQGPICISKGRVKVLVLEADEELQMLRLAEHL
jgi:acetate kinase